MAEQHLGVPRTISGDESLHLGQSHPRTFSASVACEYGLSVTFDTLFGQAVVDLRDTALANKIAQREVSNAVVTEVRF